MYMPLTSVCVNCCGWMFRLVGNVDLKSSTVTDLIEPKTGKCITPAPNWELYKVVNGRVHKLVFVGGKNDSCESC